MKVALHVGQLLQPVPGGIGRYARALMRGLPRHGVDVVPFAAGKPVPGMPRDYVNLGRPYGSMRYEMWHRMQRPLVRLPGDVVHAPSLAVPPVAGRPLVVTAHDVAFHRFPNATTRRGRDFHERGLEMARNHAALVVAPSDFTRRELLSLGFRPEQLEVAYLGADPAPLIDESDVDARLTAVRVLNPYILTVGTVEPRKRIRHLVTALGQLRKTYPDLELVVVGPRGWGDVGRLEAPGVRLLGPLPWVLVDALYRRARVCAIASVYEGFGLPAVEAMNRGCPVVVAGGSALAEVVGDAGIVAPPDDAGAMADAIGGLLADEEARTRYRKLGDERARLFTWDLCVARHADIYRRVTGTDVP